MAHAVPIVRDPGVILDANLTMQQHVKKVAAACVQLPRTATARRRVGPEVTTQLVPALVTSRLDYCNSVFGRPFVKRLALYAIRSLPCLCRCHLVRRYRRRPRRRCVGLGTHHSTPRKGAPQPSPLLGPLLWRGGPSQLLLSTCRISITVDSRTISTCPECCRQDDFQPR